jgi:hypothetical protein
MWELAKSLYSYGYRSDDLTKQDAENELFREFTEAEFETLTDTLFDYENYTVYGI